VGADIGGIDIAHRVSRDTGRRSAGPHGLEVGRIGYAAARIAETMACVWIRRGISIVLCAPDRLVAEKRYRRVDHFQHRFEE
jgi:hypothetical protein